MQSGWCLICGMSKRTEFVRPATDASVPGDASVPVRFVICGRCGHVYQDPLPDPDDWTPSGNGQGARVPSAGSGSLDGTRYREFEAWLAGRRQAATASRRLLHVGPVTTLVSGLFADSDWEVYGVVPEYGPRGLLISTGEAAAGSFEAHRFDCAVLSSVEQFADPVPLLRAIRPYLHADGVLAIAALDLLAPPPSEYLFREFMCGRQLRLYSLNSLLTVLARAGYRAEAVTCFPGGGGLGVIARPAEWEPDHPYDDPEAIRSLYHAFGWPGNIEPLGWNLAALAERQPMVLPLLCRQMESGRYLVRRSGPHVLGVLGTTDEGDVVPIARWGEMDGHRHLLADRQPLGPSVIVQMGLGSGELALALAQRLRPSQHLFVWEADPQLARVVLEAVDLSPLWHRPDVSLLLGDHPPMTPAQEELLRHPAAVFSTNAARRWNAVAYRHYLGNLNLADVPALSRSACEGPVPSLNGTA